MARPKNVWVEEDRGYETPCHIWKGACDSHGYPVERPDETGERQLHRRAWVQKHGVPIPPGYHAHHKCRVKACRNPDHIEVLTPLEHRRQHHMQARKTHCKRGHRLDGDNLEIVGKDRLHRCVTCRRLRDRWHAQKLRDKKAAEATQKAG